MTEPSEKNLIVAHDVLWPYHTKMTDAEKATPIGSLHPHKIALARYLDERDAADAQREAEVERVVRNAREVWYFGEHEARVDAYELLGSLIRAKPEPDLLKTVGHGVIVTSNGRLDVDALLELVRKGDAA